jgi:hypothetical protein
MGDRELEKFMKKIQVSGHSFVMTSALIAASFLAQACGSSNNNVSPVTATESSGTTTCTTNCGTTGTPGQVYSECAAYGGSLSNVTSGGTNVSVCRYYPYGTAAQPQYFDTAAQLMDVYSGTASGGLETNLQLYQGDKFYVVSTGHYSPGTGVCDSGNGYGDISVLGNSNGKDPSTYNGESVGLWYSFVNSNNVYSTPVTATTQYGSSSNYQSFNVPMGTVTNTLVMGYNNSSVNCGDMGAYFYVLRCADANGNTYTCN